MLRFPRYDANMETLMIILLFVSWLHSGLTATPQTYVRCRISPINDNNIVSAVLEKDIQATGCVSTSTARKNGAEVHVIRYHGGPSKEPNVSLFVEDYEKRGFDQPFIIVLASDIKVFWQVRLNRNPKALGKHTFVVSKGSGLKFAYKKMESRPSILKPKHLPFDPDDLMTWVTKRFSIVTTFTSLQGGNPLTVTVGKAQSLQSSSPSFNATQCVLNSVQYEVLNVQGVATETQPVEGCMNKNSYNGLEELIYVIELVNPPATKQYSVSVEIRLSRRNFDKKLYLILKSESEVQWHVFTTKMKSQVDIVANSPHVYFSGVKSDKLVQVRNEKLTETGMELLEWVEFYIGKIGMYIVMNNSNKLKITLPEIEEKEERKADRFKNSLTNALTTHCDATSITVALRKTHLQALNIKKNMLTLIDPSCKASENLTHVYIKSSPNECGTYRIDTQTGEEALSNTLVVHDSKVQIDDAVEGSGYNDDDDDDDVFSGSGDNEISDIMLDDEDMSLQPTEANFMCAIVEQPKPDVKVLLFDNVLFLAPFTSPIKVDVPYTKLYLEAMCVTDPHLKATIQNCWFAADFGDIEMEKYDLIENSCPVDSSVSYLSTGSPQSERVSFTVENYVQQGTSPVVKLMCQVSVCCIDRKCGKYMYPICPDVNDNCPGQPRRHGSHGNADIHSEIMLVGSMYLSHNVNTYIATEDKGKDVGGVTSVEIESTNSGQRVDSSEEKEPVVIEGLDSGTVVGIAFAAFIIGALMMGSLWFIHTHSVKFFSSGPFKRNIGNRETPEHDIGYVETTPGSSIPIST